MSPIAAISERTYALLVVAQYHDWNCALLADTPDKCNCTALLSEFGLLTECPRCDAKPRQHCTTATGNVLGATQCHSARWGEAYKLRDAVQMVLPPLPITDERHRRNANRRMHLNDQAIRGVYACEHDRHRGQFVIIGYKVRTGGRVTLATFKYRANEEMYWPMYAQARALAEGIVSQMNAINLVLKDPRDA